MFTTPMVRLLAVIRARDADEVSRTLLEAGVLHMVNVRELADENSARIRRVEAPPDAAKAAELRRRIENVFASASIELPSVEAVQKAAPVHREVKKQSEAMDGLVTRMDSIRKRQSDIQNEIQRLEELGNQMKRFGPIGTGISRDHQFLRVHAGGVDETRATDMAGEIDNLVCIRFELPRVKKTVRFLLIVTRHDDKRLMDILSRYQWIPEEIPGTTESLGLDVNDTLTGRIDELKKEQAALGVKVREMVSQKETELRSLWADLRMIELNASVRVRFGATAQTVLFTGWVPKKKANRLDGDIRQACNGLCDLEWSDPRAGEKPPVQLRTAKFLEPFKMLVTNYGIPAYGSVDPTPFVFVAYLLMFALMFADAGHGLVIALAGLAGLGYSRKSSPGVRNLMKLLVWCGVSAIVAGIVFGAYFGMSLFPAVWFNYHAVVEGHSMKMQIMDILGMTMYLGIGIMAVGMVLNGINLVKRRQWLLLMLDRSGLLGAWVYAGGIYSAIKYVKTGYRALPPGWVLFWAVGFPAIIMGAKPMIDSIIENRQKGKKVSSGPAMIGKWIMDGMIEMLEMFIGYLSNTLSFMRIAGLGIAHVSLMAAFASMAVMAGGGIKGIVIVFLGNVLVIVLEGLSAGVQSLRLNYYEFFSKYFTGNGKAYSPISFRSKT